MKCHVLSLVEIGHYFAPTSAPSAQTERRLIFSLCVARAQILAARMLPG